MDTRRASELDNYSRQINARQMMMPPMSAPMGAYGGMPFGGGGGMPFGGGMPYGGGMHRPIMPLRVQRC